MIELILVYDIATRDKRGEQRLRRVAKICEGFGVRVQWSVFECRLTEASLERFLHELREVIEPSADRVTVYKLSGSVGKVRLDLGKAADFYSDGSWIL
jgi:CRISPR-associated protein Cas2